MKEVAGLKKNLKICLSLFGKPIFKIKMVEIIKFKAEADHHKTPSFHPHYGYLKVLIRTLANWF